MTAPTSIPAGLRPIIGFFVLTFALTWLFWIPAAMAMKGLIRLPVPFEVAGLLGAWAPGLVAIAMTGASSGRSGLKELLDRIAVWRVPLRWYAFAFLWPAALSLLVTGLSMLLGQPAPDFAHPPVVRVYPAPREAFAAGFIPLLPIVFATQFLGSSLGEEIGWRGYALPRMQAGRSALLASGALGVIWGVWHLPRFWVPGAALPVESFAWFVAAIALSAILYTWVFNGTGGSLLPVLLLHTSQSTTDLFLGRIRNPQLLVLCTALLVAVVVLRAGAARLGRAEEPVLVERAVA